MRLKALRASKANRRFVSGYLQIVKKDGALLKTVPITRASVMRRFDLADHDIDEFAVEYEKFMASNVIPAWRQREHMKFAVGKKRLNIRMKDVDHIDVMFEYEYKNLVV